MVKKSTLFFVPKIVTTTCKKLNIKLKYFKSNKQTTKQTKNEETQKQGKENTQAMRQKATS